MAKRPSAVPCRCVQNQATGCGSRRFRAFSENLLTDRHNIPSSVDTSNLASFLSLLVVASVPIGSFSVANGQIGTMFHNPAILSSLTGPAMDRMVPGTMLAWLRKLRMDMSTPLRVISLIAVFGAVILLDGMRLLDTDYLSIPNNANMKKL